MSTITLGIVAGFRDQIARLVTSTGLATYSYLPDDVAHLPCYVIGRPGIREGGVPGVMSVSLDVTLLGRRISDEDSQRELDAYADQLFITLGGTRNTKVDDTFVRCDQFLPGSVIVAGLEMPAYIASVTAEVVTC